MNDTGPPGENNRRHVALRFIRQLLILVACGTLVACLARFHWLADLCSHFRVQYCLFLIPTALLMSWAGGWKSLIICLVCLGVNAVPIVPYLSVEMPWKRAESQLAGGKVFRLLSLNVLTSNENTQSVADLIFDQQPDFVVLMETNGRWETALTALGSDYPYREFVPGPGNFGIAFLSKHPWRSLEVIKTLPLTLPSLEIEFSADVIKQAIQPEGQFSGLGSAIPLRIIATHPIPPISGAQTQARDQQLIEMAGRAGYNGKEPFKGACLMAGDFNLTPWSPRFQRVLTAGQLTDSGLGFGVSPTWGVFNAGIFDGLKIDHILVNDKVAPVRHAVMSDVGSDHRGVLLDFRLLDGS